MKTKVSELTKEKLAEWTARAQLWIKAYPLMEDGFPSWIQCWFSGDKEVISVGKYRPDINGAQAMELQKKFCVDVRHNEHNVQAWACLDANGQSIEDPIDCFAETGQDEIAICRAVVASVYGEYVEEKEK